MINVRLSDGFGNNLFQVLFAELLSARTGVGIAVFGKDSPVLRAYEGVCSEPAKLAFPTLPDRNLKRQQTPFHVLIDDACKIITSFGGVVLKGNYEYHEIFDEIDYGGTRLSSFQAQSDETNSIVIHLRMNNRLVQANHALNWLDPLKVVEAAKKMAPELPLEIVSDFDFAANNDHVVEHLDGLANAVRNGPNPGSVLLPRAVSERYLQKWRQALSVGQVRVVCVDKKALQQGTGGLTEQFLGDFGYLQRASMLFFWGSTFSYMAWKMGGDRRAALCVSPWKRDKNDLGPYLDRDPKLSTISFEDVQYRPQDLHSRLYLFLYRLVPNVGRHYFQAIRGRLYRKGKRTKPEQAPADF